MSDKKNPENGSQPSNDQPGNGQPGNDNPGNNSEFDTRQRIQALETTLRHLATRIRDRCAELQRIIVDYQAFIDVQDTVTMLHNRSRDLEDEIHALFGEILRDGELDAQRRREVEALYEHLFDEGWLHHVEIDGEMRRSVDTDAIDEDLGVQFELDDGATPRRIREPGEADTLEFQEQDAKVKESVLGEFKQVLLAHATAAAEEKFAHMSREAPETRQGILEREIEDLEAAQLEMERTAAHLNLDHLGQVMALATTMGQTLDMSAAEFTLLGAEDIHQALLAIRNFVARFHAGEMTIAEFVCGPDLELTDDNYMEERLAADADLLNNAIARMLDAEAEREASLAELERGAAAKKADGDEIKR